MTGCDTSPCIKEQYLNVIYASSRDFSTFPISELRCLRQACPLAQPCRRLFYSHTQNMETDGGSNQNPQV